jgi:N-acetylglucosaminyldiphosphoundecaprenol N-acetyl-beta-D-mannosaminyltransferase
MKKIKFLNCNLDLLTIDETVKFIDKKIQQNEFIQQVVVNVAKIVNLQNNQELSRSVQESDLINIDGMGIIYGAKLLNLDVKKEHKVSGIDLFFRLLQLSEKRNYKIFLLGATDEVINIAQKKIIMKNPNLNIVGYHNGYFWNNEEEIVKKIKKSKAQLLFVAITSPLKENFINRWKKELNVNYVMGVGGTFDILSGKINRAPIWMQKNGLEWIYRIIQEPKRMWKRYLFTNAIYLFLVIKEKFIK